MTLYLDASEKDQKQILVLEHAPGSLENEVPTTFTKGQLWGALRKTWKAYKISKAQDNKLAMMKYADRIRTLQLKLGLALSKFSEVGLT